jgi:hypothetical protein
MKGMSSVATACTSASNTCHEACAAATIIRLCKRTKAQTTGTASDWCETKPSLGQGASSELCGYDGLSVAAEAAWRSGSTASKFGRYRATQEFDGQVTTILTMKMLRHTQALVLRSRTTALVHEPRGSGWPAT